MFCMVPFLLEVLMTDHERRRDIDGVMDEMSRHGQRIRRQAWKLSWLVWTEKVSLLWISATIGGSVMWLVLWAFGWIS